MSEPVKAPRGYDSSGRLERARRRRRDALAAALDLIGQDGYAVMTMAAVAERAGVSVEFLYKTFGDKPGLVRELLDFAAGGDDEPVAMADRPWIQQMIAEPDAAKVLAMYAELATATSTRAGALLLALAAAAPADPRLAQIWEVARLQRLGGAAAVARNIAGKAELSVSEDEARDVIWTLNSPELHHLLVHDRRWTPARFESWLADALCHALL